MMTECLAEVIRDVLDDCSPADVVFECHDLFRERPEDIAVDDETVVVIGMPVYVGKIPLPAAHALRNITGSGAMTLAAVSYSGRTYGNALFELKRLAEDCGFKPIGAGAFLVSHFAVKGGRHGAVPDQDTESIHEFAIAASKKIKRLAGCDVKELKIKPMPVEVSGRMPVHKISRISPKAAAAAQKVFDRLSFRRKRSEWFL